MRFIKDLTIRLNHKNNQDFGKNSPKLALITILGMLLYPGRKLLSTHPRGNEGIDDIVFIGMT